MAVVDSNYCFRYIDVGAFGREGESNVLKATDFGKSIYNNTLDLPPLTPIQNDPSKIPMPYVFVADEAFGMCQNIMRPYTAKNLLGGKGFLTTGCLGLGVMLNAVLEF